MFMGAHFLFKGHLEQKRQISHLDLRSYVLSKFELISI